MQHALLLVDIVDSTSLVETLGDRGVAALWARHDRVARDLVAAHRGREIDKTDGFLLLFDGAADAVACALAYHEAIAALDPPLRARAGVHVGPVVLRENPAEDVARGAKPVEVEGLAKPIAARVSAIARGGQTLLTASARAELARPDLRVGSHGWWRLHGVAEPIELFEVGRPDATLYPPPDGAKAYRVVQMGDLWLPARDVPHALPAERDAFVGRDADLRALADLLDGGASLVSVLGIGGTGKTRLVTRFAWTWLGDWPGGAWFCDLSEARDDDGVAAAVARALDVRLAGGDAAEALGRAIAERGRCLVILDNFEQVARGAPRTLGRWLDRAPEASFVVTTREVLGLPGETTLALAPLGSVDGLALFALRAAQAARGFTITEADRPLVEALVRLLDGLPLAIELAAARVRVMPPKLLLQRMTERFRVLASAGGRHTRQATLRGALDWSWDLLSEDERRALAQLAVFEGSFGLDAAEAVLSLDEAWPLDAVQALVDKSLVRRVGEARFDMLVTVQEYAAERLAASGGRAAAEARHGAHYANAADPELMEALHRHGSAERRRALALDVDNLIAACRRAVARGEAHVASRALRAVWVVVEVQGPYTIGVELGSAVLALPALDPSARFSSLVVLAEALKEVGRTVDAQARVDEALAVLSEDFDPLRKRRAQLLALKGMLAYQASQLEACAAAFEEQLAILRPLGDLTEQAFVLGNLGIVDKDLGRFDAAREHLEAAIAIHRAAGNRRSEGITLLNLAILFLEQGKVDEVRAPLAESLAASREVGNHKAEGAALATFGGLAWQLGDEAEAGKHWEAALVLYRAVGARALQAVVLGNLALVHERGGDVARAVACNQEALAVNREVGNAHGVAAVLGNLGALSRAQGRAGEAVALLEEAVTVSRSVGDALSVARTHAKLARAYLTVGRAAEARACVTEAEGACRELGADMVLGDVLCAQAWIAGQEGRSGEAATYLAEAEEVAARTGSGPGSPLGKALAELRAGLGAPSA